MTLDNIYTGLRKAKEAGSVVEISYEISQVMMNALIAFNNVLEDDILESYGTVDLEIALIDLYHEVIHSVGLDESARPAVESAIDYVCNEIKQMIINHSSNK